MTTHRKYTYKEIKEIAEQYKIRTKFKKGCHKYYYAAWKNGLLDILFPKNEE